MTQKFFIDARVGLNKIFFPTYLNGNDQTLLDSATNIRTRNATTGTERWRDRYQTNATGQYYVDETPAAATSSSSASTTRTCRSRTARRALTTST